MNTLSALQNRFWHAALVQAHKAQRREQSLTGLTHRWWRQLPAACRPDDLCRRHPGVANRIARCWSEPGLCAQLLDDLLNGTAGDPTDDARFPPGVQRELRVLRDLRAGRRPVDAASWLQRCLRYAGLCA